MSLIRKSFPTSIFIPTKQKRGYIKQTLYVTYDVLNVTFLFLQDKFKWFNNKEEENTLHKYIHVCTFFKTIVPSKMWESRREYMS